MVLDRAEPLGGEILEGNVPRPGVGPLRPAPPIRHGLTIANASATWYEHGYGCALTVVPCGAGVDGCSGRTAFLVAPSPNMPTLDTAHVYPGGCLIEGTNPRRAATTRDCSSGS
jgi:beta-N-acetylhexosaminidase